MSIENILTRISLGTVDLDNESHSTKIKVLSGKEEVLTAMSGLTNESVDIMLLVYLGDVHAGKRLHHVLVSHIAETAKEQHWKEFETGTGKHCWEMISITAIGEFLHSKKKVRTNFGLVELDSKNEPVTVDFKYSDRKLANILMINKDTSARKGIPGMHRHITSWLESMAQKAGSYIERELKAN